MDNRTRNRRDAPRQAGIGLFGAGTSGGGGTSAPLGLLLEADTGGLDYILLENGNEIYLERQ